MENKRMKRWMNGWIDRILDLSQSFILLIV